MKKIYSLLLFGFLVSCNETVNKEPQFELLTAKTTGINFSNDLVSTDVFNVYKYRNFYNGG